MEKKEIDELAAMGQALVEIDRQFSDLDGITMRQLSELGAKFSLTVVQVMAVITLAKWNRLYRKFSEMGNSPPKESQQSPVVTVSPFLHPRSTDDEIVDLAEKREDSHPRIEFL
ncbi:MAG: hypothetical protein LUQ13_01750 [Methanomicrobiales archaeon]|nr:hypothetical protein [Methanomicrobiales archaeon]